MRFQASVEELLYCTLNFFHLSYHRVGVTRGFWRCRARTRRLRLFSMAPVPNISQLLRLTLTGLLETNLNVILVGRDPLLHVIRSLVGPFFQGSSETVLILGRERLAVTI